jgi:hypothetical protein
MSYDTYFAADEGKRTVHELEKKSLAWYKDIQYNKYLDRIRRSWAAYHGAYYDESHAVTFGGEQGELVNLAINHFRNLAQHMLVMVTATRPSFQARSVNTDRKSQVQTKLANGLLDYYMREKRLERHLKRAVEYAITMGSGFIKMEWNSTRGEIYDYIEPIEDDIVDFDDDGNPIGMNGEIIESIPIYEGDVEFSNLSPFDVVFDSTKETSDQHDWVLCRSFINKFDLAAKYPELAEDIIELPTKDEQYYTKRLTVSPYEKTDDVVVYEFYHRRTESMPNGRYLMFLEEDVILEDTPMPYRRLPVYRIAPADILGTPYGYTPMFDLLPIQDAVNSLYSTVMTNQSTFGVQNILNPRGNDVKVNQLEGGLNFIEYNHQIGAPEPLQLTNTPGEIFNFLQMLEKAMETISGVNSVARGNPESSLRSGNALALVQSQALQFMSGLQQSYIQLIEDVGTGLIQLLQDFASTPRVAAIVGLSNRTELKEFKSSDIDKISRVVVDVGNALMQCLEEGTEVMMADGSFKEVQDIKVGDQVMGWDSKPKTVEKAGSGHEEMFEVRTKSKKDEHIYTCNKSHIMTLKYCSDYKDSKKGDIIDISVKDYLELSEKEKNLLMGFRTNVEFDTKETPLDPYYLGLWIGDGNRNNTSITTSDSEIVNYLKDYSLEMGLFLRKDNPSGNSHSYHLTSGETHGSSKRNPIMNNLRELELIQNKHIPHIYKYNDEKTLLNMLAGFIDADGTLVDQTFVIAQKEKRILEDFQFVARSLGFKATLTTKTRSGENTFSKNDEVEYHVLNIGGDTWRIPTKLPRKQAKEVEKQKDWKNYGIKLVSKGYGKYYGFTLKEDPHFLLKDFTVTHNTTAGRAQVAENLLQMGVLKTPEQYLQVMNTGNLDTMIEGEIDENETIRGENERLINGEDIIAIAIDNHSLHIREHKAVLSDQDLRRDPELVKRTLAHIQEHIELLRNTDPDLLTIVGQQPLAPQGAPAAGQAPPGTEGAAGASGPMQGGQPQVDAQGNPLPQPASPPGEFAELPTDAGAALAAQAGVPPQG